MAEPKNTVFAQCLLRNWRRLRHQKRFALGMNKRLALGAKWTFVAVFVWGRASHSHRQRPALRYASCSRFHTCALFLIALASD